MDIWDPSAPWAKTGVLSPAVHSPIILNRHHFGNLAGLGTSEEELEVIWQSLPEDVTERELDYIKSIKRRDSMDRFIIVYLGDEYRVEKRMRQMVGAFIRNSIDARIMSLRSMVKLADDDYQADPRVLFIRDFGSIDQEEELNRTQLFLARQYLAERLRSRKPTVLFTPSAQAMNDSAGERLVKLITPAHLGVRLT